MPEALPHPAHPRPLLCLLATGGTIAGDAAAGAATRYTAGALDISDVLAAVPGLERVARLQAEQVASIGSQDMSHEVWLRLAARIDAVACQREIDGIVVTHGTDTLEETAYFLSLVLFTSKPVVLVAAMRPAGALGADGPANLACAVAVAADRQAHGRGPLVVMNDLIHGARGVMKARSSGVEAFSSGDEGPVGRVHAGVVRFNRPAGGPALPFEADSSRANPATSDRTLMQRIASHGRLRFDLTGLRAASLPAVSVLFVHVGMDCRLIDQAAALSAGIVIAGVGEGNMPDDAWQACRRAAASGVTVVRASRCPAGAVSRNGELDDDSAATVAAVELSAAKARILLMLSLTQTREPVAIQQIFDLA